MKLLIISVSFLALISCNNKNFKLPKVIPLDESSVITQEFVYDIDKAPTPECHASTIAVCNDVVVASWFGGTKEKNKDVGIWIARKAGTSWSTPIEIANGIQEDGTRYPCWNPVLFQPKNSSLYLFYKIGPSPKEWWGLYIKSDDTGKTWSKPVKLADGILGPIKNQPIQLSNGDILSPSSEESLSGDWTIHVERSRDSAKTWTKSKKLNTPSTFAAIQPTILNYDQGKLQLLSRTKNDIITEIWSEDYGETWGNMEATSLPNPNSGIDGVTLKDGRQLLVYNPTKENWGNRVPLSLAISTNGKKWKRVIDLEPLRKNTDKENEEYSYPTIIQSENGNVHIVYTWNRRAIKHIVLDPTKL
ncbi:sialidase family protein [Yeosuana marina]|uniref:sialidase family protein n=1 Tax=Yeosuana marina TaxID=1565536 RepID=UPI0030C82D89